MAQSGIEMMLRSMGLSEVLDMAKHLAEQKTLEKILKFGDDLERLQATVTRIETLLSNARGVEPYSGPQLYPGLYPPPSPGLFEQHGPHGQTGGYSVTASSDNSSCKGPDKAN